jgi:hypothetical protein
LYRGRPSQNIPISMASEQAGNLLAMPLVEFENTEVSVSG